MRIVKVFILLIIFTLLLLVIPSENVHIGLSTSAQIISAIASLGTLLVALLLFSKFDVEKSIIQKQVETVLSLFVELKKQSFVIKYNGGVLIVRLDSLNSYSIWEDKELLFAQGYINGLENIFDFRRNIFLPKEIADKLDGVRASILTKKDKEYSNNCLHLYLPGKNDWSTEQLCILNQEILTLGDFIKRWDEVIVTSKDWLKNHSMNLININFD